MRLTHTVEARQQQNQRIDPRQILASEILAWTTSELEVAVEREMNENPALEARDGALSVFGEGSSIASPGSPTTYAEDRAQAADALMRTLPRASGAEETRGAEPGTTSPSTPDPASLSFLSNAHADDGNDPMDRVVSHLTLHDHLREQVGQVLCLLERTGSEEVLARIEIVRYLVECVDDRGYLVFEPAEVAERFRAAPSAVEAAVKALQAMDPPGVGARDLRECLLLQVDYLELTGEAHPLARRVLRSCWDDLVARREERVASRLRTTLTEARAALHFVQRALTPYPGSAFRPTWGGRGAGGSLSSASSGTAAAQPTSVRPDIVFYRTEAGYSVELARDLEGQLLIAPLWQKLAEKVEAGATPRRGSTDESARRYVRDHVDRAQAFLNGVARRGRTLRAIARALIEYQQGFIETGNRAFLRPLTRQALAEKLNLDESVISRAVAEKWAQLPGGEVVPLDAFFGNAHAVREALVSLIASEDPSNPYSDDEIADYLTAQGFPLARRTVAKYRGLEKILPARLRKRNPSNGPAAVPPFGPGAETEATLTRSSSPDNVTTAKNGPPPPPTAPVTSRVGSAAAAA